MNHSAKEIKDLLMSTADNMAAAAASFTSHGYDAFISAREVFRHTVEEVAKEVEDIEDRLKM
jgi:hypothetical protein